MTHILELLWGEIEKFIPKTSKKVEHPEFDNKKAF